METLARTVTSGSNAVKYTQRRFNRPMTDAELMQFVPAALATEAHESRSKRYAFVSTAELVKGLRSNGFEPFACAVSRTRDPGKQPFSRHMLRLRHVDQITQARGVNEITIVGSHDGTSGVQLYASWFEFMCENGLVYGAQGIEDCRIKHTGNAALQVVEAAFRILESFREHDRTREEMQATVLTRPEARLLAQSALDIRYEENDSDEHPITVEQALQPRRFGSEGDSVWQHFNNLQENLTQGGVSYRATDSLNRVTRRQTRPVQAIDTNTKLNRALHRLAVGMLELKHSS